MFRDADRIRICVHRGRHRRRYLPGRGCLVRALEAKAVEFLGLRAEGEPIIAENHSSCLDPADQPDARRRTLISSLQLRYREALKRGDAKAKLMLFREAIYLDIQPQLFTDDH